MSLWSRIATIFGAKMDKALDKMENPAETLDYSYKKQVALLADVKRGLAEIATSKQRLKLQNQKLLEQDTHLQDQAQRAVAQGRDDLAREALQRRAAIRPQIESMDGRIQQLDEQQVKLQDAAEKLQTRIQMFASQKEALKAQYSASAAQVKINESFTGLSKEMTDIGTSVQRAQDRIEQMQARSAAIDELMASGALEDYTAQVGGGDDIERQLQIGSGGAHDIEAELAAMKAQLPSPQAQPQLESHEQQS
ncbi:MAG TPA: PspA/IM30 family protein [Chloroflexota bacterium]|nr:PspA/IM30 family protein [Chloroflexota bacterium]